jgi:hypothetical protein
VDRFADIFIQCVLTFSTFQDGTLKQSLGKWRRQQQAGVDSSRGLTHDRDPVRIAPEFPDVFFHPPQSLQLVKKPVISR